MKNPRWGIRERSNGASQSEFALNFTPPPSTSLTSLVQAPYSFPMSENQFDGLSDNEWDETWEFAWSEFEWERHLREQDKTVQAYLGHYDRLIKRPDRIDEAAHLMGWDQEGWTTEDPETADAAEPATEADADKPAMFDPYTIQKHPVYVSTHGLFVWLGRAWDFVAPACGTRVPMRTALAFSTAIANAEHNGLLAVHSLDMGDFSLSVCLLKRALADLNAGIRQLQSLDVNVHPAFAQFHAQALIRIFDIREIWLRVMRDCRAELDRRVSEGES